jgi:hypothetical protein
VSAAVFVGPTLSQDELARAGDFTVLPPVAQGDVYRAARRGARVIGIVDGYFSGAPSVWHKEILWAMSQGVVVFGSASMGALRAAELHAFGMRGVGRIFEAFRDGAFEDDDEVAVLHGPAEIDYLAASEPMANIRATLEVAEAEGVLRSRARAVLERYAKGLFFGERNWPALLEAGDQLGVAAVEVAALGAWLPEGRVDQKRRDALAMLAEMQALSGAPAREPNFHFEWTYLWDVFVSRSANVAPEGAIPAALVLDELRLQGLESYRRIESRALLRAASRDADLAEHVDRQAQSRRLAEFRSERGLYLRADLDRWMSINDLEAEDLQRLIEDETRLDGLRDRIGPTLNWFLLDELRLAGDYPRLAERARRKSDAVASGGDRSPSEVARASLPLWWFEQRLRRPTPEEVTPFALRLGFADLSAFERALYRERLFLDLYPEST